MKIINKLNDIDDKHVEEAIKIDNKKKLMGEKMKENNKKSIWKYIFVPVTCTCALVMAIIYINNNKDENKIVRTNNKYLTANYSMLLYSEADSYIKENVDLSELKENKSITIDSNKILKNVSEEYKYCSGEVIITKNKFGMYEHTVKSSCDNESKENINLTMKVYTNVNQNSEYQILSNVTEKEDGYTGVLSNYIISSSKDIATSKYDGVSGVVKLDKDLNISDLKLLDKPVTGMSTNIYSLKDNYIITNYPDGVNGKQVVSYYDSNLKLLWSKSYENYTLTNYLTETNDKILFGEFNKVIYINKRDGSFDSSKEIGSISNATLSYKDNYLFLFDYLKTYKLYKYDLNGKELLAIDLLNIEGINKDANIVSQKQGNNVSIFRSNNNLYVFDKEGKLINTIDINNNELDDFNVLNDSYEIIYNISGETYKVLEDGSEKLVHGKVNKYVKYDLNNNIINSVNIDNTYGYNMLENLGLVVSNMAHNSYILSNKLFEYMYSQDNNGTLVLMVYDYSKVNDIDDNNNSDNSNNDNTTTNEEEKNIVNLDDYSGYWYLSEEEYKNNTNATYLNIKSVNNNKLNVSLYVTRIEQFDFDINVESNKETFNTDKITGNVEFLDKKVVLKITESKVDGLKDNTEYTFNYLTDKNTNNYNEEYFNELLSVFLPNNSASNFMKNISSFTDNEITNYVFWNYVIYANKNNLSTYDNDGKLIYNVKKVDIDSLVKRIFGKTEYNIIESNGRTGVRKIDENTYQVYWFATGWAAPEVKLNNITKLDKTATIDYEIYGNGGYGKEGLIGILKFYLTKNGENWNVTKVEYNEM